MTLVNVLVAAHLCGWIVVIGGWDLLPMVAAETPSHAPDCNSAIVSLMDCLTFVTGQSVSPSAECCSGVLDVHLHMPVCLCELADGNQKDGGIPNFQPELAAKLPTLCKIQGANISECPALLGQVMGGNATAPAGAVASAPTNQISGGTGYKLMIKSSYNSFICLGLAVACSILSNFQLL